MGAPCFLHFRRSELTGRESLVVRQDEEGSSDRQHRPQQDPQLPITDPAPSSGRLPPTLQHLYLDILALDPDARRQPQCLLRPLPSAVTVVEPLDLPEEGNRLLQEGTRPGELLPDLNCCILHLVRDLLLQPVTELVEPVAVLFVELLRVDLLEVLQSDGELRVTLPMSISIIPPPR